LKRHAIGRTYLSAYVRVRWLQSTTDLNCGKRRENSRLHYLPIDYTL